MPLKIIECPRDAWQGLKQQIPADTKTQYLRALIGAGFKHLDAVSFVSAKAVPQMADSELVLKELDPPDDVEIIGIVVNEKGADRAIATDAVRTLGFPYSISPTFLNKNQGQTLEQSIEIIETIEQRARDAGLALVVYVSMAFGNPYGDLWNVDEVLEAVDLLSDMQVEQISLADTVGLASAQQVSDLAGAVLDRFKHLEIGLHLHSRPSDAKEKVKAAYNAGCRRLDSALGGFGGCPFAQDELVGNLPTEALLDALKELGVELPIRKPLESVLRMSQLIALGSASPQIQ